MRSDAPKVNLEAIFDCQYERIARVIAGVIRDSARAEELAVDVFLKWERNPKAHGEGVEGWLYRTAIRTALNELRRERRRSRYEELFGIFSFQSKKTAPTPEEIRSSNEAQERVRTVLGVMAARQSELLLLRNHGFSYAEIASALHLNPASIGTLLSRAEETFRKEYTKRYGQE